MASVPIAVESALLPVNRERMDRRIHKWATSCLRYADVHLEIEGSEHIAPDQNYVVLSNHQSSYDIFVLFAAFPKSLRMAAKSELFEVPVFGRALEYAEFIRVDRGTGARAKEAVSIAKKQIDSGVSVWMAPEGTRSLDGLLAPFKKGGFILALESQTPILPVTLVDTHLALPAGDFLPQTGSTMKVVFHPPIDVSGKTYDDRDELLKRTRKAIASIPARTQRKG